MGQYATDPTAIVYKDGDGDRWPSPTDRAAMSVGRALYELMR
jgi:hypothetical protein